MGCAPSDAPRAPPHPSLMWFSFLGVEGIFQPDKRDQAFPEVGHPCTPTIHLPAVRLTTEAVPAVMASTWEWISCFDSSILFLRQAFDA